VLRLIAQRVDADALELSRDELLRWPRRVVRSALRAGLVRRAGSATAVTCDECGDAHYEDVLLVEEPPGSELRAYILCPEHGRVRLPLKRLRLYGVDLAALAHQLAAALSIRGAPSEAVPGRLWRLGLTSARGASLTLYLARRPDDALAVSSVRAGDVVLCAGTVESSPPEGTGARLVAVADVAELTDSLRVDRELITLPTSGAPARPQSAVAGLDGDGWYAYSKIAAAFGVSKGALQKQLIRYMHDHADGWKENEDRRPREPKQLFQLAAVRPVVEALAARSRGRPANVQRRARVGRK
jgi:hypothetical protein